MPWGRRRLGTVTDHSRTLSRRVVSLAVSKCLDKAEETMPEHRTCHQRCLYPSKPSEGLQEQERPECTLTTKQGRIRPRSGWKEARTMIHWKDTLRKAWIDEIGRKKKGRGEHC